MLQHQCMAIAAAGGRQQHGLVGQRVHAHQVKQMLEVPRERTAIHGGGGNQQIGRFDGRDLGLDLGRQFLARQRGAQRAGDLAQVHDPGIEHEPLLKLGQERLNQHQRARRLMGAAIDGDNFQRRGHNLSPGAKRHSSYLSAVVRRCERTNSNMHRCENGSPGVNPGLPFRLPQQYRSLLREAA